MINPIEKFFALHKRIVRKSLPRSTKDLLKKIFKGLEIISYYLYYRSIQFKNYH